MVDRIRVRPMTGPHPRGKRHYRHPRVSTATRKDRKYWFRRLTRLIGSGGVATGFGYFFINTVFPLRRKVRFPWFEDQRDGT